MSKASKRSRRFLRSDAPRRRSNSRSTSTRVDLGSRDVDLAGPTPERVERLASLTPDVVVNRKGAGGGGDKVRDAAPRRAGHGGIGAAWCLRRLVCYITLPASTARSGARGCRRVGWLTSWTSAGPLRRAALPVPANAATRRCGLPRPPSCLSSRYRRSPSNVGDEERVSFLSLSLSCLSPGKCTESSRSVERRRRSRESMR